MPGCLWSWGGESSHTMPSYTILLFGPASAAIGQDRVVVESSARCTSAELKSQMAHQFPTLETHVQVGRLAVNQGFADAQATIDPDDEIALITMVSGG